MPLRVPSKVVMITATLFLVMAFFLPIAYHVWGVPLVADIYNERSVPILNQMIRNHHHRPLEHYYAKAKNLLSEATMSLLILSLVLYSLAKPEMIRNKANFLRRFDIVIFSMGLMCSMIMVFWLKDTHHGDIYSFIKWQTHLKHSLRDVYIECDLCNYPILGFLFSAGIFRVLHILSPGLAAETYVQLFRYVLSITDGINVLLVYLILKALSIRRSLFWAGLIGLLPSSWVGGALWGQIDGFTQLGLLTFLFYTMIFINSYFKFDYKANNKVLLIYLFGSSMILSYLLLTKQLAIFSVPILVCMVFSVLYLYTKENFLFFGAIFIILLIIGTFLPDIFLDLRYGYFSHLQYIFFGGGSSHINHISGNGFNIWMFLGWPMSSSSKEPFFSFLSPKNTGVFLFITYEIILFALTLQWLRKHYIGQDPKHSYSEIFLTFVFLLALTNLAFNVFFTGTHERHLYHFYPFALIAYLGFRQTRAAFSKSVLAMLVMGSLVYGRFVWGILESASIGMPHEFVALFHLGLLCFLTTVYVRYQAQK